MVARYLPDRGDLVWLDFDPALGHEQNGRRPALVLSKKAYNGLTGMAIVVPCTSKVKGYVFEIVFKGRGVSGAVLADQVHCYDWRERRLKFIERTAPDFVAKVLERSRVLFA